MKGIGQRIKEARKALQLSQTELGRLVGTDQSAVSLWENERTLPERDKIPDLARVLYLTPQFLEYGAEAQPNQPRSIRVTGYVIAGNRIEDIQAAETVTAPLFVIDDDDTPDSALVVKDHSMWPIYRDRDVLYYREKRRLSPSSAIGMECVVVLRDGDRLVKRLMSGSRRGLYTLSSYNAPEIQDVEVSHCHDIMWIRRHKQRSGE